MSFTSNPRLWAKYSVWISMRFSRSVSLLLVFSALCSPLPFFSFTPYNLTSFRLFTLTLQTGQIWFIGFRSIHWLMHVLQKRWPHNVTTGSFKESRHIRQEVAVLSVATLFESSFFGSSVLSWDLIELTQSSLSLELRA